MTPFRITLFGSLRVQIGEREITRFSTQKNASLLAYLAYYRHQSHPREVLIEMLWPECEPEAGRGRLRTALWSLRRQLESPDTPAGSLLHADAFSVSLNPALVTTDVTEFLTALRQAARASTPAERVEHLQRAVSRYQGELLPGYYEDWALREQRRLAELHEQAVCYLASYASHQADVPSSFLLLETAPPLPTEERGEHVSSLPPSFTRFFGREEELARLQVMLSPLASVTARPRLVTITGTGGTGKTRLSLEAARRLLDTYSGSIWFAPLADLRDSKLIGSSLVDALSLPRSGSLDPLEQVIAFFKERQDAPSMIVLDNFEQLVEGGAEIVQTLLERVPSLTLLVTSRRLLHLSAEREFALLPLPTPQRNEPLERLTLYESVQLFIDRAQNARPDFQVTNKNAAAVAELCYRLEGIPLALELAASRALMLTPAQMLSQMERRFGFLVSKKRDVVERHRTLQAAIEWSFKLLSPELQIFFAKLSVFRGGWTLEAVEVVSEEPNALEYLEQLREWSLIQADETDQGMRYWMLETLREYAAGHLLAEESVALAQHHAHYYLALAQDSIEEGSNIESAAWYQRMTTELDNLRAVFAWSHQAADEEEIGLQLAVAVRNFWHPEGRVTEGREQTTRILSAPCAASRLKTRALLTVATLAWIQSDYEVARSHYEECRSLQVELNDTTGLSDTLNGLGAIANEVGDLEASHRYYTQSLEIARQVGDTEREARTLTYMGIDAQEQGRLSEARMLYEQAHKLYAERQDIPAVATVLNNLANIYEAERDYDTARKLHEEALALQRTRNKPGSASSLYSLGVLALHTEDAATAMPILEESLALWREMGHTRGVAKALYALGVGQNILGNREQAYALMQEALAMIRAAQDMLEEAKVLVSLSEMTLEQEEYASAWEMAQAALRNLQKLNARLYVWETLVMMARIVSEWKRTPDGWNRATQFLGTAASIREDNGVSLSPKETAIHEKVRAALQSGLGEDAFAAAWEAGYSMTWQEAVAYALEETSVRV